MIFDPYSVLLRSLFAAPDHAGDVTGDQDRVMRGEASESASGARLELTASLAGATLDALRFRAFGCPHLVAAAEWTCDRYEGQQLDTLGDFDVRECMDALDVPVEKTGRILLIEDAIKSLVQRT